MRSCECGSPKSKNAAACERCSYLDQTDEAVTDGMIVSALRSHRFLSLIELAEETGRSTRNVLRRLHKLEARGRVEVREIDFEFVRDTFYKRKNTKTSSQVQVKKVYSLTEPRKAMSVPAYRPAHSTKTIAGSETNA